MSADISADINAMDTHPPLQQTARQAEKQAHALGLLADEFAHICSSLSRPPNQTELGIFAAMWSEHCSYKSTRHLLKTLPTEGTAVIAGPGENAGAVDIGDGMAAVFKIESHNHPSFISPYQGAATGVGGILRDIFTMGARPIAVLNSLHFGDPHHRLTPHFLTQVVAGIGGYGNAIGIPTIGGESHFSHRYNNNILVNAMAVGIAKHEAIFRSAARGIGNLVVYIGAKTGRDGIQGASMASAELSEAGDTNTSKRPSVQIGDPLLGKLVMEACLELMAKDLVLAAQDMGAAGLTSSSVEMASKGGVGVHLYLDKVPVRETNMTPQEIMLSESQERMLLVLSPDALDAASTTLAHWEVDFAVIGEVTKTQKLQAEYNGTQVIDLPIELIAHGCPPSPAINIKVNPTPTPKPPATTKTIETKATTLTQALKALLASPALADRTWIYQQYDRHVMADTALASGQSDAAVVRVHGTKRGLALTTDCTHRYVEADPYWGAALAVAEAQRNISAVGATPLAVTNNLNFGNPYKPEIMTQLTNAVAGMGDACRAFGLPVVSGNVSLHNETDGKAIAPTPVIGMLGVLEDVTQAIPLAINKSGLTLFIIGDQINQINNEDGLMGSLWAQVIAGDHRQAAPALDFQRELKHSQFVRTLIQDGYVTAAHDISDGGALVAVAEMLLAGGNDTNDTIGANLTLPAAYKNSQNQAHAQKISWAFGEGQARFIIASNKPEAVEKAAKKAGVAVQNIGITTSDKHLTCGEADSILVTEMAEAWRECLPNLAQTGGKENTHAHVG